MPFVTVDGVRLSYVEEGSGDPAVVLLHAFPLSGRMWGPQLRDLSARYRLVAPDLKGFGLSDTPTDVDVYTMDAYADEMAGLIDQLGLAPVVVVGLSMGGYVAFALMRRHRAKVRALVLADTKATADPPEVLERRSSQQRQVAEHGAPDVIDALVAGLLAESTQRDRPALVEATKTLMDQPPSAFIGGLEAMKKRPDSTGALAGIDVPVLVMVGEEDALSPPDGARTMAESIPKARFAVLPGAGHLSNIEAPGEFNRALQSFLDDL